MQIPNWTSAARWTSLAQIGQSKVGVAAKYLPLFGYLFLFNKNFGEIFAVALESSGVICDQKDFICKIASLPIRPNLLFLGFFFVGMGSLCFALSCPREIKSYGAVSAHRTAFISSASPISVHLLNSALARHEQRLEKAKTFRSDVDVFELASRARALAMNLETERGHKEWVERNISAWNAKCDAYFLTLDGSKRAWRVAVLLLYVTGISLLLIPSFAVVVMSWRTLLRSI